MNFDDTEDALMAPVWDDILSPRSEPTENDNQEEEEEEEFDSNINNNNDVVGNNESIVNKTTIQQESVIPDMKIRNVAVASPSSAIVTDNTESITEDTNMNENLNNSRLIDQLVPDSNFNLINSLYSDTNNNKFLSESANDIKSLNDPLFDSNNYLINIRNDSQVNDTIQQDSTTNDNTSSTSKPRLLFKAPRLRRRPLSSNNDETIPTIKIDNPLFPNTKNDGNINDTDSKQDRNKNNLSGDNNIVDQIDQPLFELSISSSSKNISKNSSQNDEDQEEPLKTNDDKQNLLKAQISTESKEEEIASAQDMISANDFLHFTIEVINPIQVGELTSVHTEYTILSKCDTLNPSYNQVNRRYSDFRWLYRQLQNNHWGKIIPPPSEKQMVGRFKEDFIENRRLQLENMLIKIANDPLLQNDKDFHLFLQSSNFNSDSKTRDYYSGSHSINDNNDLSEIYISEIELFGMEDGTDIIKNGGFITNFINNNKSFLSFGSSTNLPKYDENDSFFIEKFDFFQNLKIELLNILKALETVDLQRSELTTLISDFAHSINELIDIEPTKKLKTLLSNFSIATLSIRDLLDKKSSNESDTLIFNLDEYIRIISSINATFNQRLKLGQYLVIIENDLKKTKAQLDKTNANNNNEKWKKINQEYKNLTIRNKKIKNAWNKIAITIKKELSNFEIQKFNEFKQTMETFLDKSIKSQKDCIEIWETFYHNNL